MAAPLLMAALGEIFSERSGVLNMGLEGMMITGAFAGFWGAYYSGSLWVGVLAAVIGGSIIGLIMAFMSVTVGADQVVVGISLTMFCTALMSFLYRVAFGAFAFPPKIETFSLVDIPTLSQIPIIGPLLFQYDVMVYVTIILVPVSAFVLFRTNVGLKIRSVGENPRAADTMGVNPYFMRYCCVILCGAMAGVGGAILPLTSFGMFWDAVTAGRGWIALAVVLVSRWNPHRALAIALVFGIADAFQLRLQLLGWTGIPYQFFLMLPYAATIAALVLTAKGRGFPESLSVPYAREEK